MKKCLYINFLLFIHQILQIDYLMHSLDLVIISANNLCIFLQMRVPSRIFLQNFHLCPQLLKNFPMDIRTSWLWTIFHPYSGYQRYSHIGLHSIICRVAFYSIFSAIQQKIFSVPTLIESITYRSLIHLMHSGCFLQGFPIFLLYS